MRLSARPGLLALSVALAAAGLLPCQAGERFRLERSARSGSLDGWRSEAWQSPIVDAPQPQFFSEFLAPRLQARLVGLAPVVRSAVWASGSRNDLRTFGWDDSVRDQARRGSEKAFRGAVKNWLLDQVVFDRISLPIGRSPAAGTDGPRLRVGIARMLPRIGVAWTSSAGVMDWNVDARGNVAFGFGMSEKSTIRFRAEASPRDKNAALLFLSSF